MLHVEKWVVQASRVYSNGGHIPLVGDWLNDVLEGCLKLCVVTFGPYVCRPIFVSICLVPDTNDKDRVGQLFGGSSGVGRVVVMMISDCVTVDALL